MTNIIPDSTTSRNFISSTIDSNLIDREVDRNQFCVHIKTSTVLAPKELRNESRIRPPVLKADSEATVDTGIANTSLAICDKT